MKNSIKLISVLSIAAFMSACSTTSTLEKRAELDEKKAVERVEKTVSKAPKWYIESPTNTDKVVYIAGTGSSRSLTLARDKALLDAEKQLANQIDAMVSSRMKQYIREVGVNSPLTLEDNEQVVKKLVVEANIAGYAINKTELQSEGKDYRFYVLLEYQVGEGNVLRAISQTNKLITKFKGDKEKAFKELDKEIDAKRQDRDETLTSAPVTNQPVVDVITKPLTPEVVINTTSVN